MPYMYDALYVRLICVIDRLHKLQFEPPIKLTMQEYEHIAGGFFLSTGYGQRERERERETESLSQTFSLTH